MASRSPNAYGDENNQSEQKVSQILKKSTTLATKIFKEDKDIDL